MLNLRSIAMIVISLYGIGISWKQPYWGLLMLVFFYFFRPDLWGAEQYVRPVLWLTVAVGLGWYNNFRKPDRAKAGYICFMIIFLIALSNILAPLSSEQSWSTFFNIIKVLVVVYLITQLCDTPAKIAGFWLAVLAGSLWFVKVAVISWILSGFSSDVQINTAVGQGGGSNYIAWILASTIAMVVFATCFTHGKIRFAAIVCLPLWMISILVTGSRGGLLCMLAGLTVFTVVMHRIKLAFVMAIVAVCFFILAPDARLQRAKTLTTDPTKMDASLLTRFQHIQIGIKLITDNPFLGTGLDSFPKAKLKYTPIDYAGKFEHVAHNTYIQIGSESGLLMLVFLGWLNISLAMKVFFRNPDGCDDSKIRMQMQFARVAVLSAMAATWVQMLKADLIKADYMWWLYAAALSYIVTFEEHVRGRIHHVAPTASG